MPQNSISILALSILMAAAAPPTALSAGLTQLHGPDDGLIRLVPLPKNMRGSIPRVKPPQVNQKNDFRLLEHKDPEKVSPLKPLVSKLRGLEV